MLSNLFRLIILIYIAIFTVGCGKTSSSTKSTYTKLIQSNYFDTTTGVVTEDTTVSLSDTTKVTISEGTKFIDVNGTTITKVPEVIVTIESYGISKLNSEINFVSDGKKVVQTEPIKLSLPAPTGAKPGDEIKIEVSNEVFTNIEQKLIRIVVNANGTIDFIILPNISQGNISISIELPDVSTN